mmetsp:Transcript_66530/g.192076  ORF Transcript_66530/g.192076 Transcript_66530/m.192076 type:complete len:238 (-) Transcript_66530:37-750(-)
MHNLRLRKRDEGVALAAAVVPILHLHLRDGAELQHHGANRLLVGTPRETADEDLPDVVRPALLALAIEALTIAALAVARRLAAVLTAPRRAALDREAAPLAAPVAAALARRRAAALAAAEGAAAEAAFASCGLAIEVAALVGDGRGRQYGDLLRDLPGMQRDAVALGGLQEGDQERLVLVLGPRRGRPVRPAEAAPLPLHRLALLQVVEDPLHQGALLEDVHGGPRRQAGTRNLQAG